MALKTVVEDINTVEEPLRGLYEVKDGKHVLIIEDIDSHPGVAGMKSAFGKTKDEIKALKDMYKGVDPKKYAELAALEQKLLNDSAGNDPEKIRKLVAAEYDKRIADLEKDKLDYRGKFHGVAKTDRVKTAALKAGVIPEDLDDVIRLTASNFDLDETSMKIVVHDEDGNPTGETLEQFFGTSFKTRKPKFYTANVGAGGGAGGSGGDRTVGGAIRLTKEQARDVPTYRATRARAEKEGKTVQIDD